MSDRDKKVAVRAISTWVSNFNRWHAGNDHDKNDDMIAGKKRILIDIDHSRGKSGNKMRFQVALDIDTGNVIGVAPCNQAAVKYWKRMPLSREFILTKEDKIKTRKAKVNLLRQRPNLHLNNKEVYHNSFWSDLSRVGVFEVSIDPFLEEVSVTEWPKQKPLHGID